MKKTQKIIGRVIVRVALGAILLAGTFVTRDAASNDGDGWGSRGWKNRSGKCGDGWGGSSWGSNSGNLEVVGLTADQRLICFDEDHPRDADTIGGVKGLTLDNSLVGIDFRPATGELYGFGDAGGIYTLDLNTAIATLRSRLNMDGMDVALSGTYFGVDFNPTVDRLRIVSDTGQNLRVNVDTGATLVDGTLNNAGVTATGVTGAAYTNNDSDPNTATTLYVIDSVLDQVAIQAPPNAGTLNPTGKLTLDAASAVGFDIYSRIRNDSTVDVRGLASLVTGGKTGFYRINLFTGNARLRGTFSSHNQVIGIAIPLNQL